MQVKDGRGGRVGCKSVDPPIPDRIVADFRRIVITSMSLFGIPVDYYCELFRLRGLPFPSGTVKRPGAEITRQEDPRYPLGSCPVRLFPGPRIIGRRLSRKRRFGVSEWSLNDLP
jgi:hypothetical protein